MRKLMLTAIAASIILTLAGAAGATQKYVPGEIIVKFKDVLTNGGKYPLETQYPEINTLNRKYGVIKIYPMYDFLPTEPIRHPEGRWEWRHWLEVMDKYRYDTYYKVEFDKRHDAKVVSGEYNKDANVDLAEPNYYGYVCALYPHDPYMFPAYGPVFKQWNLDNDYGEFGVPGTDIDCPEAWEEYWLDFPPPVGYWPKVAVFDTGCVHNWWGEYEYYHPELYNWIDPLLSWDLVEGDEGPEDVCGHGTMVAGIIGAYTDNYFGVASLSWNVCRLGIIRITECHEEPFDDASTGKAILWAALNGADVLNFSFGQSDYTGFVHKAVEGAYDLGVIMVAARGNFGNTDLWYPASYPECIAVTALTPFNTKAPMSSWGPDVECTAPGRHIWSTTHTHACRCFVGAGGLPFPDIYHNWTDEENPDVGGTSFAAAHVSATCGIIAAGCPFAFDPPSGLIELWVRPILHASCVDIGPDGVDPYFGYGRLNLKNACDMAFAYAEDKGRESGGPTAGVKADAPTSVASRAGEGEPYFSCYPNPAEGRMTLKGSFLPCDSASGITVRVFDISGRTINTFAPETSGDSFVISWDLTARDGARVPAGVYVITASNGAETRTSKVVVPR